MAEPAEGARLLSECGAKVPPRVRIPVSPPFLFHRLRWSTGGFLLYACPEKVILLNIFVMLEN
jgi:hypothetical protein